MSFPELFPCTVTVIWLTPLPLAHCAAWNHRAGTEMVLYQHTRSVTCLLRSVSDSLWWSSASLTEILKRICTHRRGRRMLISCLVPRKCAHTPAPHWPGFASASCHRTFCCMNSAPAQDASSFSLQDFQILPLNYFHEGISAGCCTRETRAAVFFPQVFQHQYHAKKGTPREHFSFTCNAIIAQDIPQRSYLLTQQTIMHLEVIVTELCLAILRCKANNHTGQKPAGPKHFS